MSRRDAVGDGRVGTPTRRLPTVVQYGYDMASRGFNPMQAFGVRSREYDVVIEELSQSRRADERPKTLSGVYLDEASRALHDAGNASVLFGNEPPPEVSSRDFLLLAVARRRRSLSCLRGILYSALAAESYVNEVLAAQLAGADLNAVDRMSPVDKFVVGTRLAFEQSLFQRDSDPIPALTQLFRLRNKLAHPKPGLGLDAMLSEETEPDFDATFGIATLAHSVVAVAQAAHRLVGSAFGRLDSPASLIWSGRAVITSYAERYSATPQPDTATEPDLHQQALWYLVWARANSIGAE